MEANSEQSNVYSVPEVAKILHLPESQVRMMISDCELVGYYDNAALTLFVPKWQFQNKELVRGIPEMLSILDGNGVRANRLLTLPLQDGNGMSVSDYLRQEEFDTAQNFLLLITKDE